MFAYSDQNIANIKAALSEDRLSTYLAHKDNHIEEALKLYLWNAEISAAFYMPIHGLEITVRNAIHNAISNYYETSDWFDLLPVKPRVRESIENAQKAVRKNRHPVEPSRVVAELPFGFWLSLLNREYHQSFLDTFSA